MREEYYNDQTLWANGFPTLKDFIDRILIESEDHDSLLRYADRNHLVLLSKRALREIGFYMCESVRGVIFDVPDQLIMPFPEDYQSFVRASALEGCEMHEIKVNDRLPKHIITYLQTCGGELIFDKKGEVYDVDTHLKCRHNNCPKECNQCIQYQVCPNEKYKKSHIILNDGFFEFSHCLEEKTVLIEYVSNGLSKGLDECSIRVNPRYEEAISYWVHWKFLEKRVNTQNRALYFKSLFDVEYKKIKKFLVKKSDIDLVSKILGNGC